MKQEKQDVVQRVRIGLTGLACVFLLVLLSAILVKSIGSGEEADDMEPPSATASTEFQTNTVREGPRDPLAELGVAPGNLPTKAEKEEAQPPEVVAVPQEPEQAN